MSFLWLSLPCTSCFNILDSVLLLFWQTSQRHIFGWFHAFSAHYSSRSIHGFFSLGECTINEIERGHGDGIFHLFAWAGHPLSPLIHSLPRLLLPFLLFPFLSGFNCFLLLSIPFLSTRIVPLRFQARGRRKWPNLGLVCSFYFVLSVFLSEDGFWCFVVFGLV